MTTKISFEENSIETEIEHVFYGKIIDFNELKNADQKKHQEQWTIKSESIEGSISSGLIRVRKEVDDSGVKRYEITSKVKINEQGDMVEATTEIDHNHFVCFKFLAQSGMVKDRFIFNTEDGLKWEVDVFIDPQGNYYPWCKIDIEVKDRSQPMPQLPIRLEMQFTQEQADKDKTLNDQLRVLFDRYFLTQPKNYVV